MSFKRMRADKYGSIALDGRHRYSSAPELGGAELIVGKGAFDVEIYDEQGPSSSSTRGPGEKSRRRPWSRQAGCRFCAESRRAGPTHV